MPLVGHADRFSLREVVLAGQRSVEHALLPRADSLSADERRALMVQYARNGSGLVPTLVTGWRSILLEDSVVGRLFEQGIRPGNPRRPRVSRFLELDWREQLSERDSSTRRLIERVVPGILERIREMRGAGVPIMAGTDIAVLPLYPGESLHDELALLVRYLGLTPLEALASATQVPARFVGVGDSVGTIAPGMVADLLVVDADPRVDIENVRRIRGVMLGGRWFSRQALDDLLAEAARAADVQRNDWIR